MSDSLLRLAERKYVDSRASSGPTNGGPHDRVSSPVGRSTLITRAPRSPSIIAACGPASARVRSSTSRSDSGPSLLMTGTLRRGGYLPEHGRHGGSVLRVHHGMQAYPRIPR